jgi:hypothetical protein
MQQPPKAAGQQLSARLVTDWQQLIHVRFAVYVFAYAVAFLRLNNITGKQSKRRALACSHGQRQPFARRPNQAADNL